MKKVIAVCLILTLVVCVCFSACNYTRDENHLRGIYGILSSTYTDIDGETHNFADDYEYFLLIINKDLSASVRSKRVGEDEKSYAVSLTCSYDEDGEIEDVIISGIKMPVLNLENEYGFGEVEDENGTEFSFKSTGSLRLVYKHFEIKTKDRGLVSVSSKTVFKRLYKMTGDCNQKRAIRKQTRSIDDRKTVDDVE